MKNFYGDSDAAAEQLYDELMARTWALHRVMPSVTTDVSHSDVSTRLAAIALNHVRGLREHTVHASVLHALLWPTGSSPRIGDAWWATPLGQLMAPDGLEPAATDGDVTVDMVDDLVAS